jgi:hypothetical protein
MTKIKTIGLLLFLLLGISYVQAQCPGCTISLPTMPVDTVYLDTFPTARQNVYYQENLSFRLPMTTTPLIGLDTTQNIPANVNLSAFVVQGISGLPLGLNYILDRPIPATYDEAAPNTRDGCVTICGTPRQSGLFTVNISISVETGILPPQPATIPLSFLVLPDTNAAFVMTNSVGCAPLTVNFTNNVSPDTSFNQTATYSWDFGNGQTSTAANPGPVTYSDTANFTVNYEAVIATPQRFLSSVVVTGVGCNDNSPLPFPPTTPPDLFLTIIGSASGTDTLTGYTQDLAVPVTFNFGNNIPLVQGSTYDIRVQDNDEITNGIPPPADCGTVTFSADTSASTFTLTNGSLVLTVTLTTSFVYDTVSYTDVVYASNCNTAVGELESIAASFNVFPNPTSGTVQVQFTTPDNLNSEVSLKVSDVLGRNLKTENMGIFNGNYSAAHNLKEFGTGIYLMQLQIGNRILHKKIVVR